MTGGKTHLVQAEANSGWGSRYCLFEIEHHISI